MHRLPPTVKFGEVLNGLLVIVEGVAPFDQDGFELVNVLDGLVGDGFV